MVEYGILSTLFKTLIDVLNSFGNLYVVSTTIFKVHLGLTVARIRKDNSYCSKLQIEKWCICYFFERISHFEECEPSKLQYFSLNLRHNKTDNGKEIKSDKGYIG